MDVTALEEDLRARLATSHDLRLRTLRVAGHAGFLIYADSLVDKSQLNRDLVAPLQAATRIESMEDVLAAVSVAGAFPVKADLQTVETEVVNGRAVVVLQGIGALKAEVASPEHRQISEPATETTTRGPRDSFVERLTVNLGLIRMRVRDPHLIMEPLKVGVRTQTSVALVYLDNLANPGVLATVRTRVQQICVDGVVDDATIQDYLTDRAWSPFPLLRPAERPDWVVWEVLQGKVAILVDGSATALLGPVTVVDFYRSPEDYRHDAWQATYLRLLRMAGFVVALFLPSVYVAVTDVTPELLPAKLALSIAASRQGVPFPAIVEVVFMELGLELLREATLRMPRILASTIGIVGGVVLGQAAVGAKMVSDVMIIVISLTAVAQFTAPSQEMGAAWRTTRFLFAGAAAVLGLYGLALISFLVLFYMAGLHSLGVPYLSAAAASRWTFWSDGLVRLPMKHLRHRMSAARPQEATRAKGDRRSAGGSHDS